MYPIIRSHIISLIALSRRIAQGALSLPLAPFRFSFPRIYKTPRVVSAYPGPKTAEFMKTVNPYCKDANTIEYVVDYKKSRGNYFCDIDSNVVLDLEGQDGTLPLGYNDKAMIKLLRRNKLDSYQLNGGSLYMYPTKQIHHALAQVLRRAPHKLPQVLFAEGPPTSAIELAVKMALLRKGDKEGKVAVLGDAVHGGRYGSLFCLEKGEEFGVDVKTLKLPFPELIYPLEMNREKNAENEKVCLNEIKEKLTKSVAAIIVSPIQV
eukprot:TRINITY_DN7396_c0_g1_i10.p1 TRINITY_DN7396_c0_g1~~TRINITY_DN7396_c0_g1_i10.p1  ORF type:complete len:264 (-),score=62.61 TRINITY_DN7396_c0_g1_i10:845-1636(-)